MGGGLLQIVAYGVQDTYLTGNPEKTLFKTVYRRHTNFAMESIKQPIKGHLDFGKRLSVKIARNGDLLSSCHLEITVRNGLSTVNLHDMLTNNGYAFIDYIELEIAGQVIDKQYGEWMNIWSELTLTYDKLRILQRMIDPRLNITTGSCESKTFYIPLQFWFCRHLGSALPLIALQYHDIVMHIKFNELEKVLTDSAYQTTTTKCNSVSIDECILYCDFMYLDTDERRSFVANDHQYLIEQVQLNDDNTLISNTNIQNIQLTFNHPVKELVWIIQDAIKNKNSTTGVKQNNTFNYWNRNMASQTTETNKSHYQTPLKNNKKDHLKTAVLQFNGHDRFRRKDANYFRNVQRFQHHTGSCSLDSLTFQADSNYLIGQHNNSGIYIYSFALEPEKLQPTGTCNFSRIDSAVLALEMESHYSNTAFDDDTLSSNERHIRIYATNYNILNISEGMGGLAYSN